MICFSPIWCRADHDVSSVSPWSSWERAEVSRVDSDRVVHGGSRRLIAVLYI